MRRSSLGLLWLAAFLLIGCAAKPQDLIVGKWETTDITGKIQYAEFSKDGTCSIPVPLFHIRRDGKYRFIDDDHIEMELPFEAKPWKRKVVVTKETLTLTDTDQGKSEIFKRAK